MPDDYYSDDHHDYHHMDHEDPGDTKAMTQPKADYWAGYYDFLINEGSYKFWAVFEVRHQAPEKIPISPKMSLANFDQ